MTKNKQLILIALFLLVFFGCRKDDTLTGHYDRPTWLAGKLYTQIKTKPELSTFAELLKISGYDTIIDVSGSYTVFAPSDDAFKLYFQENAKYKSVAEMPKAEVIKLVKYHMVQDQWSKNQLKTLDVFGWIDTLDLKNNLPKGYKRQTLLRDINQKYGVKYSKYKKLNTQLNRTDLIDTLQTSWRRRVFSDSRKFSPIFFKEYFDIYNLSTSDYAFYFGRQFENANDLYFSNGRIVSDEIFAENGFVYVIDRVAEPLKNGTEILSDKTKPNSYSLFYNLVNRFAEMNFNEGETNKQPGANLGFKVDSLFNLNYPLLVFDINSEKTKAPRGVYNLPGDVTIRYHHGIVAPTNEALNLLVSQYLAGGNNWGSIEAAPENIKRIIANSSLSTNPIYLTDVQKGFLNGEADIIKIDESSIVQKQYGSNCTFIGVNKPIVPRAFSSVAGPIYTRKGFSKIMMGIEKCGMLSALKRKDANYSFYVESDANTAIDSSFIFEPGVYSYLDRFSAFTMYPSIRKIGLSDLDLRLLFLNHIAIDQPKAIARKEFIKNMAGNYLIYNNVTKEVKGTAPTTYGYLGAKQVVNIPRKISTNSDNGTTYEIDNWFNFSITDFYVTVSNSFPKFHALIKKAGYSQDKLAKYSFMSDNQNYTLFAPSDSLLNTMNYDFFTPGVVGDANYAKLLKKLQDFVLMHFVQGEVIFTDGNKKEGYYETARISEYSTPYNLVFSQLRIVPGIDKITIPGKSGFSDLVINESLKTNLIMSRSLHDPNSSVQEAYANSACNGVIHEIKKPLLFEVVDVK
jgi:hypothetical protein